MNERQARAERKKNPTDPLSFSVQIGFFAGMIWGGIRWLAYTFHFTSVIPGMIAEPFYPHKYLITTQGQLVGWGAFILFSIAASILYTLFLRKVPGPYPGILYGIVWWVLLYVAPGPMLGLVHPVWRTTWNTIWTESCIMLVWGLFIGYTVATEFNNEQEREPDEAERLKMKGGSGYASGGGQGSGKSGNRGPDRVPSDGVVHSAARSDSGEEAHEYPERRKPKPIM